MKSDNLVCIQTSCIPNFKYKSIKSTSSNKPPCTTIFSEIQLRCCTCPCYHSLLWLAFNYPLCLQSEQLVLERVYFLPPLGQKLDERNTIINNNTLNNCCVIKIHFMYSFKHFHTFIFGTSFSLMYGGLFLNAS